jgi:hypothetical protein
MQAVGELFNLAARQSLFGKNPDDSDWESCTRLDEETKEGL